MSLELEVFYVETQRNLINRERIFYHEMYTILRKNVIEHFKKNKFFSEKSYNDHMIIVIESTIAKPNNTNHANRMAKWLLNSVDDFAEKDLALEKLRENEIQSIELGFEPFSFLFKVFFDSYYRDFCPDCSFCEKRILHPFTEAVFSIQIASSTKKEKDYLGAQEVIKKLMHNCVCLDSPEVRSVISWLSLVLY